MPPTEISTTMWMGFEDLEEVWDGRG